MKIAILGAGAMGCLIGGLLQKSGEDVLLISRNESYMDAVKKNGLELQINGGSERIAISASTSSRGHGAADMVILLVKGPATAAALENAGELIGEKTYVLTLQNGLGNIERIEPFVSKDRILQGIVKISGLMVNPGVVKSATVQGVSSVYIGSATNRQEANAMAAHIAERLCAVGVTAEFCGNAAQHIWEKAANNCAVMPACAIAGTRIKDLVLNENGQSILRACMAEFSAVAAAKGITIDAEKALNGIINHVVPKMGAHIPSLAQDVQRKKITEIDSLNGQISAYGRELGIPTPVNDTITNFIKVIEANYNNPV